MHSTDSGASSSRGVSTAPMTNTTPMCLLLFSVIHRKRSPAVRNVG